MHVVGVSTCRHRSDESKVTRTNLARFFEGEPVKEADGPFREGCPANLNGTESGRSDPGQGYDARSMTCADDGEGEREADRMWDAMPRVVH